MYDCPLCGSIHIRGDAEVVKKVENMLKAAFKAEKTFKKCKECGTKMPRDAIYCGICGAKIKK